MNDTAITVAVISSSSDRLKEISGHIEKAGKPWQILLLQDGVGLIAATAGQKSPSVMVIDNLLHSIDDFATLEQLHQNFPGVALVLLSENMTPDFLLGAMRSGVRDILPLSVSSEVLSRALAHIVESNNLLITPTPVAKGKVVAFIACKGGSGATFIASNLAWALATQEKKEVALLDLNFQLGDALLFIHDNPPKTTVADVAANISRLDASYMYSSMIHVLPNLHVLAAPEDPEHAFDIRPEHVDKILQIAKTKFDYVVLDLGRTLDGSTVKALDHAQFIFPVLQETLPFIRDAKRLLAAFKSLGYPKDKIHLLLNRYEKGGDITLEDVENTLGMKVAMEIPNSYKTVSTSVNQGIPVCKLAPHDAVTKSLLKLAHELEHGKEKKGRWLSHLLEHS
jgi:pilus assembly protein CpaE